MNYLLLNYNYRSISKSPCLAKLFERLIAVRLNEFLKININQLIKTYIKIHVFYVYVDRKFLASEFLQIRKIKNMGTPTIYSNIEYTYNTSIVFTSIFSKTSSQE
jgi:hypothetical protein